MGKRGVPLILLPTRREIREQRQNRRKGPPALLPQLMPIGEFLERLPLVPGKGFVTPSLRRYYLYEAIKGVDLHRLGLPTQFLSFFKSAHLLEGFYTELLLDGVDWEQFKKLGWELVERADIYEEYRDHIQILEQIYRNYRQILEQKQLTDRFLLPEEEVQLPVEWLSQFSKVELRLEGYLQRFHLHLLSQLPIPVEIGFRVTQFNRPLIEKMFPFLPQLEEGEYTLHLQEGKLLSKAPLPPVGRGELVPVTHKYQQVEFLFGALRELEERGIPPEEIVVVLPDETTKELLFQWDRHRNLNFAMGWRLEETPLFRRLELLVEGEGGERDPQLRELRHQWEGLTGVEEVRRWVEGLFLAQKGGIWIGLDRDQLRQRLLEGGYLWQWVSGDGEKRGFLRFLLEELREVQLDDLRGGKVSVIGVLESRGAQFRGGVVLDFNEGVVPRVQEQDYFLNTFTRRLLGLPTKEEKEALQKGFYYNLLLKGEQFYFCYRNTDEEGVSRFGYQLPLEEGPPTPRYRLFPTGPRPSPTVVAEELSKPTQLTPTKVETLLLCPAKYYFQFQRQLTLPPSPPGFGGLFHTAIEEVLRGFLAGELELAGPEDYFHHLWGRIVEGGTPRQRVEWEGSWRGRVERFCRKDWERIADRQFQVEVWLGPVSIEGVQWRARVDRIEGGEVLIDYKTSSTSPTDRDPLLEKGAKRLGLDWRLPKGGIQQAFYSLLHPTGEVLFWDLYSTRLTPVYTHLQLEQLLEKWPNRPFKNPGSHCRYCPYHFLCSQTSFQ